MKPTTAIVDLGYRSVDEELAPDEVLHCGKFKSLRPQQRSSLERRRNPARWSGNTREGSHIGTVTLNPERDEVVSMAASAQHTQRKAA